MRVKSIAECSTIKLPLSIKTFVLSTFKWPLKTGFTVIKATYKLQRDNKMSWICGFNYMYLLTCGYSIFALSKWYKGNLTNLSY